MPPSLHVTARWHPMSATECGGTWHEPCNKSNSHQAAHCMTLHRGLLHLHVLQLQSGFARALLSLTHIHFFNEHT